MTKQIYYRNQNGKTEYVSVKDMMTVMSLDPAFSDSHSAARTAIPVTGIYNGKIFLLEDFAERGMGVEDIAHKAVDFYIAYEPRRFIIETIVAQVAVADAVRRVARERGLPQILFEELRSHGRQKKQMRIYGLEPYFRKGLFYIHRTHRNFIHEFTTFPRGQLKDVIDALSMQRESWERLLAIESSATAGTPTSPSDFERRNAERVRNALQRRRR